MNEMNFRSLPHGLQCNIYEKFSYNQFAIFESCSYFSKWFAQTQRKLKFPFTAKFLRLEEESLLMHIESTRDFGDIDNYIGIPKESKVSISVEQLDLAVPLTDELCNILMKRYPKILLLVCRRTLDCSEIALQNVVKNLKIKYLAFLHPPINGLGYLPDCLVIFLQADFYPFDQLFQLKVFGLDIMSHQFTANAIISKSKELMEKRQNFPYVRFCGGNITIDDVEAALAQFGNGCKFHSLLPDDSKFWMVTRETESEPSHVIYFEPNGTLAVGPRSKAVMPCVPCDPITYLCLDYMDDYIDLLGFM